MVFIGSLGATELVFILSIIGFVLLLPIIALVDVVRSEFRGTNDKLVWVLIILFLNILGALLYFFIGRKQRVA